MYTVVQHLIGQGHSPERIADAIPWRRNSLFRVADGELDSAEFIARQKVDAAAGGRSFEQRRFYCADDELFHYDQKTYAFTNQWGHRCIEAIDRLIAAFPDVQLSYRVSE